MTLSTFISYSYDDEAHKEWVKRLATRLRADEIDARLDQWDVMPGDHIPQYMEKAITDNDFILIICTPQYKIKSDNRKGGTGYESNIMTAEILEKNNHRKFIPILREGNRTKSIPNSLQGKRYVDLSGSPYSEQDYRELLDTLKGIREVAPEIGEQTKLLTIVEQAFLDPPDYANFEFLLDERQIDLSKWVQVPKEQRKDRISPAKWTHRIKIRKTSEGGNVRIEYATTEELIDIESVCINYKQHIDYRIERGKRNGYEENEIFTVYHIVIDASTVEIEDHLYVIVNFISWNNFQKSEEFLGVIVRAKTEEIKVQVIFPKQRVIHNLRRDALDIDTRHNRSYCGIRKGHFIEDREKNLISWLIRKPRKNRLYRLLWKW